MRLLLPSLFIFGYIAFSLIRPLPFRLPVKLVMGLIFLTISLKYYFYEWLGGSFFAPDLPRNILLGMEALYATLVILFVLLLLKDVVWLSLWLLGRVGFAWHIPFSPATQGAGLLLCALLLGCWGTWQSVRVPDVHTVEIPLSKLPKHLDGVSIVQLSDIHIRTLLHTDWLRAVVDRTNALNPDIVALTGDYNDGFVKDLKDAMTPLRELKSKYGVYGVTGNHEYYFNAAEWVQLLEQLGVLMLHNEHRVLTIGGERLVIAGVPDPSEKNYGGVGPDVRKALRDAPDVVRVLLAHQPREAIGRSFADIQLSGHSHGGLLFFMQPLVAAFNSGFVEGIYDVDGMKLYVSPGTGLWGGFSCRVGVPSAITRIVLRAGHNKGE